MMTADEDIAKAKADSSCDEDGANSRVLKLSAKSARSNWKTAAGAAAKAANAKQAVAKVKLENKIGTAAVDLDDDDDLKIVALAVQRALRDFGRSPANASEEEQKVGKEAQAAPPSAEKDESKLEGKLVTKHVLLYEQARQGKEEGSDDNEATGMTYSVYQPSYECGRMFDSHFLRIRKAFGISERQFYASLGLQENRTESNFSVIASRDGSGKSNSFFFLTPGQGLILKTCTRKDVETTSKIICAYRNHVETFKDGGRKGESSSTTLLPRIVGMFYLRFSDPRIPSVVLVAQMNFFAAAYEIHRKFDLKGSTFGRTASEKERKKKSPVYKDLDWMEQNRHLTFTTQEEMNKVKVQLQRDTEFLCKLGLIDYSLLVGVHDMDKTKLHAYEQNPEPFRVIETKNEDVMEIYYFGIVDILTAYGYRKRGETVLTGTLMCRRDVSCQPPEVYQKRFMKFCEKEVLAFETDGDGPILKGQQEGKEKKDEVKGQGKEGGTKGQEERKG